MGKMTPPSRKSCYNFRVISIDKVVDGDTIDVTIDLGFDLYKKERVRIAGIDTPEKRTRDLEEKALGIDATNWMKYTLEDTIAGDNELIPILSFLKLIVSEVLRPILGDPEVLLSLNVDPKVKLTD